MARILLEPGTTLAQLALAVGVVLGQARWRKNTVASIGDEKDFERNIYLWRRTGDVYGHDEPASRSTLGRDIERVHADWKEHLERKAAMERLIDRELESK